MAAGGEVHVKITADASQLTRELKRASRSLDRLRFPRRLAVARLTGSLVTVGGMFVCYLLVGVNVGMFIGGALAALLWFVVQTSPRAPRWLR